MSDSIKNSAVKTLEKLSSLGEIAGVNPFKVRAFAKGARALSEFDGDIQAALKSGELKKISGIGKGILTIIEQVVANEPVIEFEELCAIVPSTVLELLRIEGLGPKRARMLWQNLDIKNLGELEYALKENRLIALKGFSKKLCQSIETSLSEYRKMAGLFRLDQLLGVFEEIKHLSTMPLVIAGEVSLAHESAKKLHVLSLSDLPVNKLVEHLETTLKDAIGQLELDYDLSRVSFEISSVPVQMEVCSNQNAFGAFQLFYRSGSDFWQKLVGRASSRGMLLTKSGLEKDGKEISAKSEEEVFSQLDLHTTPPEAREGHTLLVPKGKPFKRLIELKDLRGAFHNHTLASDGKNTLAQMRQRAIEMGLSYLSISDHSRSAVYANGLVDNILLSQVEEIEALNKDEKGELCHLFTGTESDILKNGELDYPNDILRKLDVVIASVHSRLKQDSEQMTARMVNAAKNPLTTIIGHPTGRLILDRPESSYDMTALIQAASESKIALELNANPHRLDLSAKNLHLAQEASVPIAINADAHSVNGLNDLEYGIMIARRAGLRPENVLNCMSLEEVKYWLQKKREQQSVL